MHVSNAKRTLFFVTGLFLSVMIASGQQGKNAFTVTDEIGLTLFETPNGGAPEVHFSPDGNYFAAWTERGRLDVNDVEDSLRFYRTHDVENFLAGEPRAPLPLWVVNRSSDKGPIINDWRWMADSSGVAFMERTAGGDQRLVLANLRTKRVEPLPYAAGGVKAFDVRDQQDYVYTVDDPAKRERLRAEHQAAAISGPERHLFELLFPDDPLTLRVFPPPSYLWAVAGGKRFQVKRDGAPIIPKGTLVLSPDGSFLVTILSVSEVPSSWETLYPPPFASDPYRFRAGGSMDQYVLINLQTGSIQALTNAPIKNGMWATGHDPSWSSDGQKILLPGTFVSSKDHTPSRPCVAIVDLPSKTTTCVEMLKGHTETGVEEGYHLVKTARFADGDKQRIAVNFYNHQDLSSGTTEYEQTADGKWLVKEQIEGEPKVEYNGLEIAVKQGLNAPPLLVATGKQGSRVIWDPNPQLKNIELGMASVYTWKDKEGRVWRGGLYKPSDIKPGHRYPLVIQTHGFMESEFRPSGLFPTAFAARALAAAGIVVLQTRDDEGCPIGTLDEGPCAVSDYEAAAGQLVSEGLVDSNNIGIIGFSRTCFYVMETLTTGSLRLKAASITDGVMGNYLQYMTWGWPGNGVANDSNSLIGAPPFGEGLRQWFQRSPGFKLDRVNAPLLVAGSGPISLLGMWEAYVGLDYLKKPVDLIMLNTSEHVLTNPAARMASQGGSVDWFRFWLKGEEDHESAKVDQYARWHELRKLQEATEHTATTPNAGPN